MIEKINVVQHVTDVVVPKVVTHGGGITAMSGGAWMWFGDNLQEIGGFAAVLGGLVSVIGLFMNWVSNRRREFQERECDRTYLEEVRLHHALIREQLKNKGAEL